MKNALTTNKYLKKLNLSYNQINSQLVEQFIKSVEQNNKTITDLNLIKQFGDISDNKYF